MSQETSEFTENIEVSLTTENSETCRYCLEILDCEQGDILNPCECKSLVHKKCFIHWLRTRPFNPLFDMDGLMICEICKKRYNRSVKKYVNKANNGNVYLLSWSRIVNDQKVIKNFKDKVKNTKCKK